MNFINYFFEIVVPRLLEYFKDNAKDVPYSLLSEVLINNKNYEEEVMIDGVSTIITEEEQDYLRKCLIHLYEDEIKLSDKISMARKLKMD